MSDLCREIVVTTTVNLSRSCVHCCRPIAISWRPCAQEERGPGRVVRCIVHAGRKIHLCKSLIYLISSVERAEELRGVAEHARPNHLIDRRSQGDEDVRADMVKDKRGRSYWLSRRTTISTPGPLPREADSPDRRYQSYQGRLFDSSNPPTRDIRWNIASDKPGSADMIFSI